MDSIIELDSDWVVRVDLVHNLMHSEMPKYSLILHLKNRGSSGHVEAEGWESVIQMEGDIHDIWRIPLVEGTELADILLVRGLH